MTRSRFGARLVVALFAVGFALGTTPLANAVVDPAPTLWSWDAPFTRSQLVSIGFIPHNVTGNPARYRVSNSPATGPGGILTNGTDVPIETDWTLAAGPDGSRTVYGQVQDTDGTWTDADPLVFELDRTGTTALVIDGSRGFQGAPDGAHVVVDEATTPIIAGPIPSAGPGSPPEGFVVQGGGWTIRLGDPTAPIVAGMTYVSTNDSNTDPGPFAEIAHLYGCSGPGTFTVRELDYSADGDVERAAVDFNLCTGPGGSMSGSIRYGSSLGYAAIGQSTSVLFIPDSGQLEVGQTSATYPVTLRNDGTSPTTFGNAAIVSDVEDEFSIVTDTCSGATLGLGDVCVLSVRAHPLLRAQRWARLEMSDETPRGKRSIDVSVTALQPTTTTLVVTPTGTVAPTTALAVLTITPAYDTGVFRLDVDGAQAYFPTETVLTSPSRLEVRYTVPLGAGDHVFLGQFIGGPDYYLSSSAPPITVHIDPGVTPPDSDPPVMTPPMNALVAGGRVAAQHITWGATDADSGLATVVVERSVDSQPFAPVAIASLHDLTMTLSPGHTFQFRVRATDQDGNTSAWSTGARFSVASVQESSHAIVFDSRWTRAAASTYWGGADKQAVKAGAKATFTFTGRAFSWVSAVGPTRGQAQVYVDGALVATVDLHAGVTAHQGVVFARTWSTSAHHVVVIKVLGTAGHPRVDLDAFVTST